MAKDLNPPGWRQRWLRLVLVGALVAVIVGIPVSAMLWLASRGLLTTFPQVIGRNCGEAYPGNDPLEAQRCFWQAYQRRQAATLVFIFPALDEGTTTHAITVQRTDGQFALTDSVQSHSGGFTWGTNTVTTYACAGLTQHTRGLLLEGCEHEGNVYLPPRPVEQLGVVCGEVDHGYDNVSAGYGGVDGFGSETVARAEGCFWQAYSACVQPYTLLYALEDPVGPTYTFVVQQRHGACALSVSEALAPPNQGKAPITYACAALTRPSTGGLVAQGCGAAGTITVPPATAPFD